MAAQVAGDEPDIAENSAQAPKFEMTNPPGMRVSHRSKDSYKSAPARVEEMAAPIMINIGIEKAQNYPVCQIEFLASIPANAPRQKPARKYRQRSKAQ